MKVENVSVLVFPSLDWCVSTLAGQYIHQPMFSSGRRRVYVRRGRKSSGAPDVLSKQLACARVCIFLSRFCIFQATRRARPPAFRSSFLARPASECSKKAGPAGAGGGGQATEFGRAHRINNLWRCITSLGGGDLSVRRGAAPGPRRPPKRPLYSLSDGK